MMKANDLFLYIQPYNEDTKDNLKKRVYNDLGHEGSFYDDIWIYKNHANYKVSSEDRFKLSFGKIPTQFKEITKFFILRRIQAAGTMNRVIFEIANFFNFIINKFGIVDLKELDYFMLEDYKIEVEGMHIEVKSIRGYWRTLVKFFSIMSDFEEVPNVILPNSPNYEMLKRRNAKLVELEVDSMPPKEFYMDLDRVFIKYKDAIPIYIQSIYWTLRLIPSRINEVCDMDIYKTLRSVNNEIKITIPVTKTSTHINIKEKIISLTGKSEAEKFLTELIEKQREVSISLQSEVKEKKLTEGLLYTVKKICGINTKLFEQINYSKVLVGRVRPNDFNKWLRKIVKLADTLTDKLGNKIYNFRNEQNELYHISSHDFRHEGITSRIDYGFLTHEVMFLSGLATEGTIFEYYTSRKDSVILSEPIYNPNCEIKNSDEKLIKSSDIVVSEAFDEINSTISFQGNADIDEVLLDLQVNIEQQTPIVTNEGYYLGNCPNYYNCIDIKKELKCIGCKYTSKEIVDGGLEFIEKAIKGYASDIEFHKANGNIRMANLAENFYNLYTERKRSVIKGVKND